jgi:hypothetical protein
VQEVYNRELVQEPGMMGSLAVKMTIEPGGMVSDLRFPLKRVSSEKLTAAVYDQMRSWTFPPAEAQVDVHYRMVFVPSGIDQVSIVKWESLLGDHVVMDQPDKSPPPAVATAVSRPTGKPGEAPSEKISRGGESKPVVSDQASREAEGESASRFVASWYRVTRPSSLYAAPRESATVVTQLRPGKRIWVVGVIDNDWLEVHSMTGRAPGFLSRDSARPEQFERTGS